MSIASGNDEIGADVRGQANEIASIRLRRMHTNFVLATHAMFFEIVGHIPYPAMCCVLFVRNKGCCEATPGWENDKTKWLGLDGEPKRHVYR